MEANRIEEKIYKYGADILASEGMQKEKNICATWFNNLLRSFPAGGGEKSGACREMFRIY